MDTEFGVTQRTIALDDIEDNVYGGDVSMGGAVSNRRMASRMPGASEVQRAEESEMKELSKGQRNAGNSNNYSLDNDTLEGTSLSN